MGSVYYNEIDPFAAEMLKHLMAKGMIASGIIDTRSIEDVCANDIKDFTQCHFFAGIGVWSYALRQSGWPDDRPIWTGSCPCQPFSSASKAHGAGKGIEDERHLWPAWHYLIKQLKPSTIVGEQVGNSDGENWLGIVCSDLEEENYSIGAANLTAAGSGAPHIRKRIWFFADASSERTSRLFTRRSFSQVRPWRAFGPLDLQQVIENPFSRGSCFPQPLIRKVDDGFANRVGALRCYGNAIVTEPTINFLLAVMDAYDDNFA